MEISAFWRTHFLRVLSLPGILIEYPTCVGKNILVEREIDHLSDRVTSESKLRL